jgi:hypothetical protein
MRSHDEACKILLKIEELIKPLNKGPKVWSDHLAKVGTIGMEVIPDYLICMTINSFNIVSST